MQREGFLLLPKKMDKGNEPNIVGYGVSVEEAQSCLLELGIHMKVTQSTNMEGSNIESVEPINKREYGIQAYD